MYPNGFNMTKPKNEHTVNVPDELLRKLLTDSEWRMVKQRFLIVNVLNEGMTIRQIAEKIKVGTDTVVRVARMAEKGNLRKILKTAKKTKTPWIFGKAD